MPTEADKGYADLRRQLQQAQAENGRLAKVNHVLRGRLLACNAEVTRCRRRLAEATKETT